MALTPEQLISTQEWNKTIKNSVQNALGAKLDGSFVAVNYPAGFNVFVKQQYYNKNSLTTLDLLLSEANKVPTFGGPYSTLYKSVISNLAYGFSSVDKQLMKDEENEQATLVGKISDLYQNSGLDEKPEVYPCISQIMKRIKEVTGSSYLDVDFKEYPQLATLCRNLSEYARLGVQTAKMQSQWDKADDRFKAIEANITKPSKENGGLNINVDECNIGWDKLPTSEQLLKELTSGSKFSISIHTSDIHKESSSLHFATGVTAKVPFNWFFNMSVDHQHEYDLSKMAINESSLDITISYEGLTMFSAVPTPLTLDNRKGWFDEAILNEAAKKSGMDTTGYQLHGSQFNPNDLFGENGSLRRLKTYVISQAPTITMRFSSFKSNELKEAFSQKNKVNVSMFGGLINVGHSNDYSSSKYNYDEEEQILEVVISPTPIGSAGAPDKQTAFVLGGVSETYKR